MRVFLDNKGVSTLWSQFKAKLAVHANNSDIHVTAEEKVAWDGKAELSDIPTTLPANGGNADTVGNLPASSFLGSNTNFNYRFANGAGSGVISSIKGESHIFAFNFTDTPTAYGFLDVSSFDGTGFAPAEFGLVRQVWTDWANPSERFVRIYKATSETDGVWTDWSRCNADTLDGKHANDFIYARGYLNGIDLDDIKYPCSALAINCVHSPSDQWGTLLVYAGGTGSFTQIYIPTADDGTPTAMYFRHHGNTGWTSWSNTADGGNADTLDGKHAAEFAPYHRYAPIYTGDILDIPEMGTYSCAVDGCTNLPSEIASWCYVTAFDFRDAGYKRFICVALNDVVVYPNVIWLASESNKTSDGKLIWSKANDGGNAATVNGYTVNANVPAGFSSIGQNTENKTYTYRGTTYTGSNTSEVFNNYTNMAANEYSHAEGSGTKALGDQSHAEGSGTKALGFHSHAECSSTEASGDCSHAEGMNTTASGESSHAEGSMTTASSSASHAEGSNTRASGNDSHAEGSDTTASSSASHAEGSNTRASGNHSHAEGYWSEASGEGSHAEGSMTSASSSASHAEGYGTTASSFASHAGGKYNKAMTNSTGETDNTGDAFVIGNGTETSALSNAFRVTYGGAVYGLSAFNSSGADYAEFIKPWYDGNTEEEDRVGYFVTIKDGLLYKANEGDYIVGITSGNPSVVGNADEDYYWRYERDEFNRFVYEDAEEEVEQLDDNGTPVLDENGMPVMVKTGNIIKNAHYKLAADYNPTKQNDYIERKNRPEWSYVGMVGVIPVRDDGTCEAGCFCKCGQNGIATRAESRGFDTFFVIERISDNVVSVEIR